MLTSMPIEFYKEGRDLVLTSFPFCSRDITCMSAWIKRKILDLINRGETWECEAYLLQQRALEEFNIFVRVLADIPSDWPSVRASDTPSMLTAIAKLLQIFAAYSRKDVRFSEESLTVMCKPLIELKVHKETYRPISCSTTVYCVFPHWEEQGFCSLICILRATNLCDMPFSVQKSNITKMEQTSVLPI